MALDPYSPAVREFILELEDELDKKRIALERDKNEVETAHLRGQIKSLRVVLKLITGDHEDNDQPA